MQNINRLPESDRIYRPPSIAIVRRNDLDHAGARKAFQGFCGGGHLAARRGKEGVTDINSHPLWEGAEGSQAVSQPDDRFQCLSLFILLYIYLYIAQAQIEALFAC